MKKQNYKATERNQQISLPSVFLTLLPSVLSITFNQHFIFASSHLVDSFAKRPSLSGECWSKITRRAEPTTNIVTKCFFNSSPSSFEHYLQAAFYPCFKSSLVKRLVDSFATRPSLSGECYVEAKLQGEWNQQISLPSVFLTLLPSVLSITLQPAFYLCFNSCHNYVFNTLADHTLIPMEDSISIQTWHRRMGHRLFIIR